MNRVTLRTSTIFIGTQKGTKVYRSVKEVPPKLRRKLLQTTSGANSATILIADRGGRRELAKAVRGIPNPTPASRKKAVAQAAILERKIWARLRFPLTVWAEIFVASGLGLLIWFLLTAR